MPSVPNGSPVNSCPGKFLAQVPAAAGEPCEYPHCREPGDAYPGHGRFCGHHARVMVPRSVLSRMEAAGELPAALARRQAPARRRADREGAR